MYSLKISYANKAFMSTTVNIPFEVFGSLLRYTSWNRPISSAAFKSFVGVGVLSVTEIVGTSSLGGLMRDGGFNLPSSEISHFESFAEDKVDIVEIF